MGSLVELFVYVLSVGLAFLVITFGVKYGILWAVRALSDEELSKLGRAFKR